jgi:hypothetical protein
LGPTSVYVTAIPAPAISYYWPTIEPLVQLALSEAHGELESADVYERLCDQRMQALVAVDGDRIIAVLVTEIVQYPRKVALRVVLAGGEGLDRWVHAAHEMLLQGARSIGAKTLEMHGRKGWQRALRVVGWEPSYYSMICEVDDGTV